MSKKSRKIPGKNKTKQNKNKSKSSGSVKSMLKEMARLGLVGAGSALGGYIGGPSGATIGSRAGAMVSKIIGTGDYSIKSNSVVLGSHIPSFSGNDRIVRIKHTEYLGDIFSTTSFSTSNFPLNPGVRATFPWLSGIATQFEEYRFLGLVFFFRSTSATALNSTNTALGTVIMATQYNVNKPDFTSKLEMENYEFCSSGKPAEDIGHPVECHRGESPTSVLYVRSTGVPYGEDARLYDWGEFILATVGMQAAANIGELHVAYDIELLKPRLNPYGFGNSLHARLSNGPYDSSNPLGILQRGYGGNLPLSVTATGAGYDTITLPSWLPSGRFLLLMTWKGASTTVTAPTLTLTGCSTATSGYGMNLDSAWLYNNNSASATTCTIFRWINITAVSASIQVSGGTLPTTPVAVDVYLYQGPGPAEWDLTVP